MDRLAGKVAIITGAARGQGAAEARLFTAEGARVVLTDVLEEEGRQVAAGIGDGAVFLRQDVTSEEGWSTVVGAAQERFGRVDVLVNNAGILELRSLEDTSLADFERIIRVNQYGPFLGMKAVLGPMRDVGGGSIVNISSIDGILGMNGVGAYGATKFAVRGMTKIAALEWGRYGIRVNSVHPGGVDTPMWGVDVPADVKDQAFAHQAIPRIGQPEEVARVALFLASDDSSYCTGAEFVVDGGHCAGVRMPQAPGF